MKLTEEQTADARAFMARCSVGGQTPDMRVCIDALLSYERVAALFWSKVDAGDNCDVDARVISCDELLRALDGADAGPASPCGVPRCVDNPEPEHEQCCSCSLPDAGPAKE